MVILVDMDDVLECLVEGMAEYLNKKYGTDATAEDVKEWDISKAFPTLTREQVYSPEYDDSFWQLVKPKPGGPEAIKELIDRGHQVYVVTATLYETLKSKMDDVLFKYYPFLNWKQVIICWNKQLIKGDVLVDDGPHNLIGGEYKKILFDAPHNRSFDESEIGAYRANNWSDVLSIIQSLEQQK